VEFAAPQHHRSDQWQVSELRAQAGNRYRNATITAGRHNHPLSALDRPIVLNPDFAIAFGHRAVVLSYLNRPDEAIRAAHQAIRLSPFDPPMFSFYQALARAELAAGRYDAGLSWAEEAMRENGGMPALRLKLSLCGHLGRHEETRACLSRVGEFYCEPTITGIMRALPKGVVPELAARITEGLRKAGIPEG
jgi:tetratricopeptide (TPR) repeat protein